MNYIKEININEAVIHILDNNADSAILNEYALDLNEETHSFLLKHIRRCLNDESLRYAFFNKEKNVIKDISQQYLNGENNILDVSKELAKQMFIFMRSKGDIPSCDLLTVAFSTEYGMFLGLFKMDYIKNFMHSIETVENKIGIDIIPQFTGLPSSSSRIQKCAFVRTIRTDNEYDLMIIDKRSKNSVEYGSNWFIDNYLGCKVVDNERDQTKKFLNVAERWTRIAFSENADKQEHVRKELKKKLKEEDKINIEGFSEEVFENNPELQESFRTFATESGVKDVIEVDKDYIDKKLKRVRLKIDKDIDLYISEEAYNDLNRFEIKRNGDGSINMILKHILNYIEK